MKYLLFLVPLFAFAEPKWELTISKNGNSKPEMFNLGTKHQSVDTGHSDWKCSVLETQKTKVGNFVKEIKCSSQSGYRVGSSLYCKNIPNETNIVLFDIKGNRINLILACNI